MALALALQMILLTGAPGVPGPLVAAATAVPFTALPKVPAAPPPPRNNFPSAPISVSAATVGNVRHNYSQVVLGDKPAGYWPLSDSTASTLQADSSGGGMSLAAAGSGQGETYSPFAASSASRVLQLGGSGGMQVSKSPLSSATTWTVEAWIDPQNLTQAGVIAYDGTWGSNQGFGLGLGAGSTAFVSGPELVGLVGNRVVDSGYSLTQARVWHHVAITRQSGTVRFYVDGRQTSGTSTMAVSAPGGGFSIGTGVDVNGGAQFGFSGAIADVAGYPTALSPTQIATHASRIPTPGGGRVTPPAQPPHPSSSSIPKPPSLMSGAKPAASNSSSGLAPTFVSVVGQETLVGTALDSNNNVWAWGDNTYGGLGNGTFGGRQATPTLVIGLPPIKAVANMMALDFSGRVWIWGPGYLGNGSTEATESPTPVLVSGLSGMTAIADTIWDGNIRGVALAANSNVAGAVWAWGDNNLGQLGTSGGGASAVPVQVPGLGSVKIKALSASDMSVLALDSGGNIWSWGQNDSGQLGLSTSLGTQLPPTETSISGIAQMANSGESSVALTASNPSHVLAWGLGGGGMLGDGKNDPNTSVPVTISALDGATTIAAGAPYGQVLVNGTRWYWGGLFNCYPGGPIVTPTPDGSVSGLTALADGLGIDGQGKLWEGCPTLTQAMPAIPPAVPSVELIGGGNPSELIRTAHVRGVDTATGEFTMAFDEFSVSGRSLPLDLSLTYSTALKSAAPIVALPMSPGWTHSYNVYLALDYPSVGQVTVVQENGSQVTFTNNGSGVYTAPSRVLATLTKNSDGTWTFVRHGQETMIFDPTLGTSPSFPMLRSISDLQTSTVNPNGLTTTLSYTNGYLTKVTDPDGRSFTFSPDPTTHLLKSVTDNTIGRAVNFYYDSSNRLYATQMYNGDPNNQLWPSESFAYDSSTGFINEMADGRSSPNQDLTFLAYDGQGRAYAELDSLQYYQPNGGGKWVTFNYAPSSPYSAVYTDALGNQTGFTYQGNIVVAKTDALGTSYAATANYLYDPNVLGVTQYLDPNGNFWQASYDSTGNLLTRTDAAFDQYSYTYDSHSRLTSATDPLKVTTQYNYAATTNINNSGVNQITPTLQSICTPQVSPIPSGGVSCSTSGLQGSQLSAVSFGYGDSHHPNDITKVTDANGNAWPLDRYAAGGYVAGVQLPSGTLSGATLTTCYTRDAAGRVTEVTPPLGNGNGCPDGTSGGNIVAGYSTNYTYDNSDNPLTIKDPLGHQTTYTYDIAGNLAKVKDGRGELTTLSYVYQTSYSLVAAQYQDPNGAFQKEIDTWSDDNGHAAVVDDGGGDNTYYFYDQRGNLYDTFDTNSLYTGDYVDAVGDLVSVTDPRGGQTITYGYDAAQRPTSITYSDGTTPNVSSIQYNGDNERTSMVEAAGSTSYSYDTLGELASYTQAFANLPSLTVGYTYFQNGESQNITYPGQNSPVKRTYYADGTLNTITDYLNKVIAFNYDHNRNLSSITYPNGFLGTYASDADNQVTNVQASKGSQITALNLAYRQRDPNEQLSSENSISYSYDALNQIQTATNAPDGVSFQINKAASVTQVGDSSGNTWTLGYPTGNPDLQSLLIKNSSGATLHNVAYTPDNAGNRKTANDSHTGINQTYTWDLANRLTGLSGSGGGCPCNLASYSYNGDGLRYQKQVTAPSSSPQTTNYAWDVTTGTLLQQTTSSSAFPTETTNYIMGPGNLPLEAITTGGSSPGTYYYHLDTLGSVRAITDGGGTKVDANYNYDPFGNIVAQGTKSLPGWQNFEYAGQYRDWESGFYLMGVRYYDPGSVQFLSRDPMLGVTRQSYAYAADSPVNAADPTGLDVRDDGPEGGGGLPSQPESWIGGAGSYGAGRYKTGGQVTEEDPAAIGAARARAGLGGAPPELPSEAPVPAENSLSLPTDETGGIRSRFFRGAKPGESPSFQLKPKEYRLTGVGQVRGLSVFDNPQDIVSRDMVPHEIDQQTITNTLSIEQRGANLNHYEIVPGGGAFPPENEFQGMLNLIRIIGQGGV